MNEPKCWSRIHAKPVSSSYTEQIGCTSSVNTRTSTVGRTHVRRMFRLPMGCMSISKKLISSLFASHVSSPYSIQIDSKPSVKTQIFWFGARLNQYSEQIIGMSNANTLISSLAVSHVNRLCYTYSVRWSKSFL